MSGTGPGLGRGSGDRRPRISDEELGRRLGTLLRTRAAAVATAREEAAARVHAARLSAASGRRRIVRRAIVLGLAAVLTTAGLGAAFLLARPPRPNPQPTSSLQADRSTPRPSTRPSPPSTPALSPTPEPTPAQLTATFHLQPAAPASTDIAFGDVLHGWAAADGAIFATRDGGASWTSVWRGAADVIEIQASGPADAWALAQPPPAGGAGPGGLDTDILLTTADGGRTWRTIHLRSPLIDLQLVAGGEAWALSLATQGPIEPQRLMHTMDAGMTWGQVLVGPFGAVCFADALRGWAIGSTVMRTTDGGARWVSVGHVAVPAAQSVRLTCKRGALWLLGGTDSGPFDYVLRRSTDGGVTWTGVLASAADAPSGALTTGPADIGPFDAADASTAMMAGSTADGSGTTASVTHDGGRTWSATTFSLPSMAPLAVAAQDETHLWIASALPVGGGPDGYGLFIASGDGGQTWQERRPTAGPRPLEGLAFVSSATGFGLGTLGDPGAVVRSDDGGRTWRLVGRLSRAPETPGAGQSGSGSTGPGSTGQSVSFVDPQDGWALDGTGLERTTDGGVTWTTVTLPAEAARPYAVDFRDARNGCLLASDPTDFFHALRTADGGLTWSDAPGAQDSVTACAWGEHGAALLAAAQQATGIKTDVDLSGLVIADAGHAWAIGPNEILRTVDGGAHWQALGWSSSPGPAPLDGGVVALSFPDARDGWLLTVAGRELQTTDGGLSWSELP